ncbi:proton pump-interactor BIP103-like [Chenopodium quinoa]|uniref:proton pump-interactor BIP103-like n=1 Tax=Chenopodium quinoa TaxID=63459 RepID=UPI000B79A6A3|nr:proton pump-interactor BIP103-like [Chenopodium quinoa]
MEDVQVAESFNNSKMNIHQFYFVKFPALKEEIQKAKELNDKMIEAKRIILDDSIRKESNKLRWYSDYNTMCNLESWKRELDARLREDHDSDSDSEPSINIDKKIKNLSYQFTHGSKNIASEKRIIKELKELQRKKEQQCNHVETRCSKKFIQQCIQKGLNEIKDGQESKRKVEQQNNELAKEIMSLEENLVEINKKRVKLNEYVLIAQKHLDDQIVRYNDNTKLLFHAKELATKKDLVALEELCPKQVDEFMSQWNKDNLFRAINRILET